MEWHYAINDDQQGPVSEEDLRAIIDGQSDPGSVLVWHQGMDEWLPANSVSELAAPAGTSGTSSPYAVGAAATSVTSPSTVYRDGDAWPEIVPGSEPIDIGGCFNRAFELTKRHFWVILLAGIIMFAISMVGNAINEGVIAAASGSDVGVIMVFAVVVGYLISQVISTYVSLGAIRIGLNLIEGRPAEISQLFGEGDKALRAVGAGLLYTLMVLGGMIFLIVPGIYLAIRFGAYLPAIVDRNLGVFDAFSYSSQITQNNKLLLLVVALVSFAIILGGLLALIIGLFFAIPLSYMLYLVAYKWLVHGSAVTTDPVGGTLATDS